jgi:DNA adenine methylase
MLSSEVATKERHNEIKNLSPSSDLERIFRTYYLNRTSYSGIINNPAWGYAEGKSSPPKNWRNFLINASTKLQSTEIYSKDFTEILSMPAKGHNVLIYVDPPYFHTDQKRAYTKPFELTDHYRVEDALRHCSYRFCLSYDDCPEIRNLYSWANINEVSWLYNTDNSHGEKRKACKEIIITNYDVQPLAPTT